MIVRQFVWIFLAFVLCAVSSNNNSFAMAHEEAEQSTVAGAPGEGDIAIMQKEIKWGMQEMQRYKMLRGEWPVRMLPDDNTDGAKELEVASRSRRDKPTRDSRPTVRGATAVEETAHSSYWNLLVSVF